MTINDTDTPEAFALPDTFWRVSAKALIYDDQNRLLVFKDKNGEWEIPGGGWEHAETLEQCVGRELAEEVQVGVETVGNVVLCYPGKSGKGHPKISVAVRVVLDDSPITPSGDDLVEARFVTREEFMALPFQNGEETVKDYADQIWP